jgi:SPASM domain peptide maturase of grasp-with-spasm system
MKKVMLFDCCYPIKGANRSLILDTQRLEFEFIPNSLYEILENHNGKSIQEIKDIYNNEHDETIDEYLAFLDDKEFIFYTNDETNFPKSTLSFDVPSFIDNSLIDFGNYLSIPLLRNILKQLTNLGCRVIQIRSWNIERELSQLTSFLDTLKGFNLDSIEIIWNLMEKISEEELKTFISKYPIVTRASFFNNSQSFDFEIKYTSSQRSIVNVSERIVDSEKHCGIISPHYFTMHPATFTESQHHNTCLNRKISIDQNGNIKNCPSMVESYGNIKDTTLQEALNHSDFKKYWNITKDKISICKDCEFRHICTDCRAYIENPEDILSKPLKCLSRNLGGGYNPYTCEWEDWSTNPLKEKVKNHYGMTTM